MSVLETPQGTAALALAAEWRLLALLLERPRDGWLAEIESLAREVARADLGRAAAEAADARESSYLAAFGPGGAVSPREVAYRGREDLGRIMADIAAFHEVFCFRPRAEDPLDHVAVEAGFVGYLHLKEAYARAEGDTEAARTSAAAAQRFVESHLRFFAEPLARRLETCGGPSYLLLALQALVERTGSAPAGDADGTASEEDACGAMECGGCESPAPPGGS